MPVTTAKLDPNGNTPQVEIIIGHAHFGMFDLNLYDANGKNPKKIGEGVTNDTIPDIFPLNQAPVNMLNGFTIFWRAVITSPVGTPGEKFSVFVRVIQDGTICGTDSQTGDVTGPSPSGFIRLTT